MDASRVSQYVVKLKVLLKNAFKPNFSVNLNPLLPYISSSEKNNSSETISSLINLDLFTEWIVEACTFWEEHENVQSSTNLSCFVLELAILVSKNEERFMQLSSANAYLRLCDVFRVRKSGCVPEIKLAYLKLLGSFLEHRSGVEWVRTTNSWIDICNFCLATNLPNNLIKKSYNFLYKLLESRIGYDKTFCNTVAKRIIQPLMRNALLENSNEEINEQQLKTKLVPTLDVIIAILEQYFKNECISQNYKHIPNIFFINCNLLEVIKTYMLYVTNEEELITKFANIMYLIYFILLSTGSKQYMITDAESIIVFEKVFFLVEEALNRKHLNTVAKLSQIAINYWFLIRERLLPMTHKDINNDPLLLQLQLVFVQMAPITMFYEDYFKMDWNIEGVHEMRDYLVQKFSRKVNEYTLHLLYNYREAIIPTTSDNYKTVTKHIHFVLESSRYYDEECALMMFQAMIYILHDVVAMVKENPTEIERASKEMEFYLTLVMLIKHLIENFDINWANCMESVYVVNTVLNLLVLTAWPAELTIEALKLLKLSIKKYMAPNLSLLVDRTNDSSLGQLGPILHSKLQDNHAQVRYSSLAVVTIISELSHSKFPSFQDLLQQEKFPSLILKLCETDPESSVRTLALKCLQHMVQGSVLWKTFFQQQQLPEIITRILNNETEGIVRAKAAALTRFLFINERFDDETMPQIYKIMTAATTVDLYWNVKTTALEFWDNVIEERLKNQGMIDGNFPEVTFSKERRKIVRLDENEIKRRLNVVLNELNAIGCLDVLVNAIQDDPDIEVIEMGTKVTKRFVELLKIYKMLHASDNNKFCDLINQDLDKILEKRKNWLTKTDTFEMLLNDMLKDLEQDEDMRVMECY